MLQTSLATVNVLVKTYQSDSMIYPAQYKTLGSDSFCYQGNISRNHDEVAILSHEMSILFLGRIIAFREDDFSFE